MCLWALSQYVGSAGCDSFLPCCLQVGLVAVHAAPIKTAARMREKLAESVPIPSPHDTASLTAAEASSDM